jgi:hypothetical protein
MTNLERLPLYEQKLYHFDEFGEISLCEYRQDGLKESNGKVFVFIILKI